jgi:predicted ATPase
MDSAAKWKGAMKKAIILRGPPAAGKTKTTEALLQRLGLPSPPVPGKRISLDDGWGTGEIRLSPDPYSDVAAASEEVVILELGCGEIYFRAQLDSQACWLLDARPGATRNPKEWVDLLKSQGRDTRSFLLWAPWAFIQEAEKARHNKVSADVAKMTYDFYHLTDWRSFPAKALVEEQTLRVDLLGLGALPRIIWNACELNPPW